MNNYSSDTENTLKKLELDFLKVTSLPFYSDRIAHKYQSVFGEGDSDARVIFIGEAPGKQEALTGKPFIGSAGNKLDVYLAAAGIKREDAYITSVVKDRPPKNRTPNQKEILAYLPYLIKQITTIKPQIVVTLGRVALDALSQYIPRPTGIILSLASNHGELLSLEIGELRSLLVPMYHPAAVFYNPNLESQILVDFYNLGHIIMEETNR